MRPLRVLLFGLLLTAASFAGCFGAEVLPNERAATATGGKASPGWAYDGVGVEPAQATLEASFLNAENTGLVTSSFTYAGSAWVVTFDQFAQASGRDFMDGGIAFDLVEHGDSGVADASIPKILARVAAWGTATVTRDGEPVVGAAGDRWAAHLMISDTTVRGADGAILKGDGSAPYDPNAPADAARVEADPQAFLKLVHPDGETAMRAPVDLSGSLSFQSPAEQTQTIPLATEKGALPLTLTVNVTAGNMPAAAGQYSIRVIDESGAEVAAAQSGQVLPNAPASLTFEVPAESILGPLAVEVTGEGLFTVVASGTVAYADVPLVVLTWDDVTLA